MSKVLLIALSQVGYWFLAFVIILVANKLNITYSMLFTHACYYKLQITNYWLVLRHGNVTMGMVTLACAVPLANMCFTSKFIMGKSNDVALSVYHTFSCLALLLPFFPVPLIQLDMILLE